MITKILVGVFAAGVVSMPLAGVVAADPGPTNPGTPGNLGSQPPGATFSYVAKQPGSTREFFGLAPGQAIRDATPGHQR
jgi:hypothetical protein